MLSWTISLLISLGFMLSADQWSTLSSEEKENFKSIIITIDSIGSIQFDESANIPDTPHFFNQASEVV